MNIDLKDLIHGCTVTALAVHSRGFLVLFRTARVTIETFPAQFVLRYDALEGRGHMIIPKNRLTKAEVWASKDADGKPTAELEITLR